MRPLIALLTLPFVLLACGKSAPQASVARAHQQSCSRVELNRVKTVVSAGQASLSWEVASTVDVRSFAIEQRLAGGRWKQLRALPGSARSAQLSGLADGPAEFRIWAELKRGAQAKRAARAAVRASRSAAARERARSAALDPGAFAIGLNAGYWGPCEPPELSTAIKYIRLDEPPSIAPWSAVGLNVIADESGPYNQGGVAALDASAYVRRVVTFVKANPQVWAIELLNEPGNVYFWGRNAEAAADRSAYASLIVAVHDALAAHFGTARPLILASYDGGDSSNAWGEAWTQNPTALADADMLTEHPYGLGDQRASAALGNRAEVEAAHASTNKPIAITEVGWPTTGASVESGPVEYSEAEQASNIAAFASWARATGYVKSLTIYNYRDTGPGGGFGVQTHGGAKKLSWFALTRAAVQLDGR